MALNFGQMIDQCAVVMGTAMRPGDALRTNIGRWINQACRKIAYEYAWDDRRRNQTVVTAAPYSTGTATFTEGSTTVTGSGTTWTAAMTGRKITRAIGGPSYVFTYVGATSGTLSEAYRENTASGSDYAIFADEYDLAATTHAIEAVNLIVDASLGPVLGFDQSMMDRADYVGSTSGKPVGWGLCVSTTVGTPRIRFTSIPDDVYRVNVRYLLKWTDLAGPNDFYTASLPEDVEELIIDRALRWAPRLEGSRRVMPDREWRAELRNVWVAHQKRRTRTGQRRGFSSTSPAVLVDMSGMLA